MKDTELDSVVAPASITVEEGEGLKFATLASAEKSRLLAPKTLLPASARDKNEQRGDSKHNKHYV